MHHATRQGLAAALLGLAGALAAPVQAQTQTPPATASRGELLYGNHCITCHTQQMHWRDKHIVTDWASLRAQVWRWQDATSLDWTDEDVDAVTRYLGQRVYRLSPAGQAAVGAALQVRSR